MLARLHTATSSGDVYSRIYFDTIRTTAKQSGKCYKSYLGAVAGEDAVERNSVTLGFVDAIRRRRVPKIVHMLDTNVLVVT